MKNWLDYLVKYLHRSRQKTASIAKERLQVIVAHERSERNKPDYLPELQKELIKVLSKYVDIDEDAVQVQLAQKGDCSILELNMVLPEDICKCGCKGKKAKKK